MTTLKAEKNLADIPGFALRQVHHAEWIEYYITISPHVSDPQNWIFGVREFLIEQKAVILNAEAFGPADRLQTLRQIVESENALKGPWSYLTGRMTAGAQEGGIQIHAISGIIPQPIFYQDQIVGSYFEDSSAYYCMLADVRSSRLDVDQAGQTEEVFQIFESALTQAGLNFHDVARTWFYLDDILAWYGDFNRVRTDYFTSRNIFGGIMPASTGVGAGNLQKSAVLAKAYAVRPKHDEVAVDRVDSPLQCEAFKYGSAFSRAIEVADERSRSIFVSGTASIEPGGKTIHVGDVKKQMFETLKVVDAMLEHKGMSWDDTIYAIAYFRHESDIHLWDLTKAVIGEIPVIPTQCDVCRDDLLFEIELLTARP